MELSINVHGFELTDRLQTYVEKKTHRLDRYLPTLTDVRVDLTERKARNSVERQVAQLTVRDRRGTILRAEERSNDIFAALDLVIDKMYRQISRYRGKQRRNRRHASQAADDFAMAEPLPMDDDDVADDERIVVRRKQFSLQPMSLEEATDQMELLGHDFFVFFDEDANAVNVLYRRRDGNYGLLQPEVN